MFIHHDRANTVHMRFKNLGVKTVMLNSHFLLEIFNILLLNYRA